MKCGLLGRKLGHSYSPIIHSMLGSYDYALFEKEPEELEAFLRLGDFTGINVTIPYKKDVIPFLDELSPVAQRLGAVNTVVRRPDGSLYGHNTDYFGFRSLVLRTGAAVSGKKALVLGSGGASNTAVAVLQELGAQVIVISRSGENNYDNLYLHKDASILVNATPLGMYPATGVSAVELEEFPALECVLDVIYNPAKTKLLLDAQRLGIPCANGLWMLVAQAKEAAEYFIGSPIADDVMEPIYQHLSRQMQNIILIGMPGCGKSTIAALLAQKTGRIALDSDDLICRLAGKTIPEIFSQDSEEAFRALETQALGELCKQSARIISTGGGCVTRPDNLPLLRQNGKVVWLKRDLEKLPTDGRPLSQANRLTDLYDRREPLYAAFSDTSIDNNGSPEETAAAIIRYWEESE
ncbi:MAG: shikimate kinase [Faecousia sp.]